MKYLKNDTLDTLSRVQHILNNASFANPKGSQITKYGTDGKTVAEHLASDYSKMSFDSEGKINGGVMSIGAKDASNVNLNHNAVDFNGAGRIDTAKTKLFDSSGKNTTHVVHSDFSGISWNEVNNILEGAIKSASLKPDNTKISEGALQYSDSKLSAGNYNHFMPDGKALSGSTNIDFSQTKFLGHDITGGSMHISNHRSDTSLSSRSEVVFRETGVPKVINTSNYKTNGKDLKSKVVSNFDKIIFNALKEIESGKLKVSVYSLAGELITENTFDYIAGLPSKLETMIFKDGKLVKTTLTNYAEAIFNRAKEVVNSPIHMTSFRNDGSLDSESVIHYDGDGNPTCSDSVSYDKDGKNITSTSQTDYGNAVFNHQRKVVGGTVVSETAGSNQSNTRKTYYYNGGESYAHSEEVTSTPGAGDTHVKLIKDKEGKILQKITTVTTSENSNIPTKSFFVFFTNEGNAILKKMTMDYSNANFNNAGKILSGYVISTTYDGNNILQSKGKINY